MFKKITSIDVKEIDALFDVFKNENGKQTAFIDGVIDLDKYNHSHLKIMWLLKEPNSTEESLNWREEIKKLRTDNGIKSGWGSTFKSIIYSTYGILNAKEWNNIPDIEKDSSIVDVLHNIAFVNVKKIPGKSVAKHDEVVDFYDKYKSILLKQIDVYQPDVIICGNTFQFVSKDLLEANDFVINKKPVDIYRTKKYLIIDAYHPNNRVKGVNQQVYCDSIINAVLEHSKK